MGNVGSSSAAIGLMDESSSGNTAIHRLDPRAKPLTTFVFVAVVVSFDRYSVSALLPFLVYPVLLVGLGNIPVGYIARRMLIVAPFAVLIGIFNPFLDTQPMLRIGGLVVSGGWVSFVSILVRFSLTVAAALALLATTGIRDVCLALEKLGTPQVFTVQLLFLYRYLFVAMDEGMRMARARALRSVGRRGTEMGTYAHMMGHLLLRSLDIAGKDEAFYTTIRKGIYVIKEDPNGKRVSFCNDYVYYPVLLFFA